MSQQPTDNQHEARTAGTFARSVREVLEKLVTAHQHHATTSTTTFTADGPFAELLPFLRCNVELAEEAEVTLEPANFKLPQVLTSHELRT